MTDETLAAKPPSAPPAEDEDVVKRAWDAWGKDLMAWTPADRKLLMITVLGGVIGGLIVNTITVLIIGLAIVFVRFMNGNAHTAIENGISWAVFVIAGLLFTLLVACEFSRKLKKIKHFSGCASTPG
jgi:hypothetical protein